MDFEIQADHLISARRPDVEIVNNKENLPNSGLCRPGRPQGKIKRKRRYLVLVRELKKVSNMKVVVISIVIGGLEGMVKGLEDLKIRGQVETVLLRSARILRRVLEI